MLLTIYIICTLLYTNAYVNANNFINDQENYSSCYHVSAVLRSYSSLLQSDFKTNKTKIKSSYIPIIKYISAIFKKKNNLNLKFMCKLLM